MHHDEILLNGKTDYFKGYLKNMNYFFFFQTAINDLSDIRYPTRFSVRNRMFVSISIISVVTGESSWRECSTSYS